MHLKKTRKSTEPYLDRKNTIYISRPENKMKRKRKKTRKNHPIQRTVNEAGFFYGADFFANRGVCSPLRPPLADIYLHRAIYSEGLITGPGAPENPDLDSE